MESINRHSSVDAFITHDLNRPFAGSGHMVQNKLHWNANDTVGLPKQRKVGLDW